MRERTTKKSWSEVIRNDMKIMRLTEDMVQDRNPRRSGIKIMDHRWRVE